MERQFFLIDSNGALAICPHIVQLILWRNAPNELKDVLWCPENLAPNLCQFRTQKITHVM